MLRPSLSSPALQTVCTTGISIAGGLGIAAKSIPNPQVYGAIMGGMIVTSVGFEVYDQYKLLKQAGKVNNFWEGLHKFNYSNIGYRFLLGAIDGAACCISINIAQSDAKALPYDALNQFILQGAFIGGYNAGILGAAHAQTETNSWATIAKIGIADATIGAIIGSCVFAVASQTLSRTFHI